MSLGRFSNLTPVSCIEIVKCRRYYLRESIVWTNCFSQSSPTSGYRSEFTSAPAHTQKKVYAALKIVFCIFIPQDNTCKVNLSLRITFILANLSLPKICWCFFFLKHIEFQNVEVRKFKQSKKIL